MEERNVGQSVKPPKKIALITKSIWVNYLEGEVKPRKPSPKAFPESLRGKLEVTLNFE